MFLYSICLPHARLMYVREISPNCLIFPSKLGSSRVIPLGMLSSYGFPGYNTLSAVCITGKMEVIAIASYSIANCSLKKWLLCSWVLDSS